MTEKRFTFADGFKIVAIKDNDKIMNSKQVCNKLNELAEENQRLKNDCSILVQSNQDYRAENEQLKQQLTSISQLIDNKIDEFKNGDYGDLPCNTIHMFLDLKQEMEDLE